MKINIELSRGKPYNAWECECGTIIPIRKGLPMPECEYCRRKAEYETAMAREELLREQEEYERKLKKVR